MELATPQVIGWCLIALAVALFVCGVLVAFGMPPIIVWRVSLDELVAKGPMWERLKRCLGKSLSVDGGIFSFSLALWPLLLKTSDRLGALVQGAARLASRGHAMLSTANVYLLAFLLYAFSVALALARVNRTHTTETEMCNALAVPQSLPS